MYKLKILFAYIFLNEGFSIENYYTNIKQKNITLGLKKQNY